MEVVSMEFNRTGTIVTVIYVSFIYYEMWIYCDALWNENETNKFYFILYSYFIISIRLVSACACYSPAPCISLQYIDYFLSNWN